MSPYANLLQNTNVTDSFNVEHATPGCFILRNVGIELILLMKSGRHLTRDLVKGTLLISKGPDKFESLRSSHSLRSRFISLGSQSEAFLETVRKAEILGDLHTRSEDEVSIFTTFLGDGMSWEDAAMASSALVTA